MALGDGKNKYSMSDFTILRARRVFTGHTVLNHQEIRIENGKIVSIHRTQGPFDVDNVAPGFFDTHINGGRFNHFTESPTLDTLIDMYKACVASGTPFFLPCLITSSFDTIRQGIAAVRQFREQYPEAGMLGLHLEGPFLSPAKRGAHLEKYLLQPTDELIDELLSFADGQILLMTIAPELFSMEQLRKLGASGIVLSAGHSNATYEQAFTGFSVGIQCVTHLFNAMSGLHHRSPGLVGAALSNPAIWAPLILDGIHCHWESARVAFRAKPDTLFLISDALFLGKEKQHFRWEEFDATLEGDAYVNSEGNLAGGALSLPEMLVNAVHQLQIPLQTAVEMCTSRPARAVSQDTQIGYIKPGYPPVFTCFSDDLTHFEVWQ